MANYTPGPWNIHPLFQTLSNEPIVCEDFDALTISIAKGEKLIAEACAFKVKTDGYSTGYPRVADYDENRANANLIAAAPEMYEALKRVMDNKWEPDKYHMAVTEALRKADGRAQ